MNQVTPEDIEVIKKALLNDNNLEHYYSISFNRDSKDNTLKIDSYLGNPNMKSLLDNPDIEFMKEKANLLTNNLLSNTDDFGDDIIVVIRVFDGVSDFDITYGEEIFHFKACKVSFGRYLKAAPRLG